MAQITLQGNPFHTSGDLPAIGSKAKDFRLVKQDLHNASLADFAGKKIVMNIFPSIDTAVCAMSVRTFNAEASNLENTVVLCISKDLPFAMARFCGAEGLKDVVTLSMMRNDDFAADYGLNIVDGPMEGLLARAVVILDENGVVKYTELVPEIAQEPDYENALKALL